MQEWLAMDRRALMQRVLVLAGAGAAASACQTIDAVAPLAVEEEDGSLSAHQMAVLSAAAERIIPQTDTAGAIAAGVPERFNGLMVTWASPETRATMERVLADIDGLPGGGRSFADIPTDEQHTLLAAHDAKAMQPSDAMAKEFFGARQLPVDPDYGRFKDLVVSLYYMSQEALTHELLYYHVPGRWQPSIPVTPETRPWGEVSLF